MDNLRRAKRPLATGFRFMEGDIRDRELLTIAMQGFGIDIVFHLAAQSNVIAVGTDLEYSFSTNVVGTFGASSAARVAWVHRVEPRQVEVSEFIACVDKARACGLLDAGGEQPLQHLEREVEIQKRHSGSFSTAVGLPLH